MNVPLSTIVIAGALGLLGVGLYAAMIVRNLIKVVVALQIIVKGALLALILAGRTSGQLQLAQGLALTVIVADTIVAVVALALAVQVRRVCGTLDLQALATLRR